jgi:hypothetical protein
MIFTVPLQPGTLLANVLKKWIAAGVAGTPDSVGITQPDATFAVFRIDDTPPADAEEVVVYDSSDLTNWNVGSYAIAFIRDQVAAAQQLIVVNPIPVGTGQVQIIPSAAPSNSICRCYGTFNNLSNIIADGLDVTFTLVQVDVTDPTIAAPTDSMLVYNRETGQLISDRVINATIVAGQLQDALGNSYVDLCRTDYMNDKNGAPIPQLRYLLNFDSIGAKGGLVLSSDIDQVFTPVTFVLDTTNLQTILKGTFNVSKLKPS